MSMVNAFLRTGIPKSCWNLTAADFPEHAAALDAWLAAVTKPNLLVVGLNSRGFLYYVCMRIIQIENRLPILVESASILADMLTRPEDFKQPASIENLLKPEQSVSEMLYNRGYLVVRCFAEASDAPLPGYRARASGLIRYRMCKGLGNVLHVTSDEDVAKWYGSGFTEELFHVEHCEQIHFTEESVEKTTDRNDPSHRRFAVASKIADRGQRDPDL